MSPEAGAGTYQRIAVMGAGAVGGYFGGMLARAGLSVTMIGRPAFVAAVARDGLLIDSVNFQQVVRVKASAEPGATRGAELVLFSVKTLDSEAAAKALAPFVEKDAVVLSLQNGVENVECIRAAAGLRAVPSVVYVAASAPAPGRVKHVGRGDLVIGWPRGEQGAPPAVLEKIAATFAQAGVPCKISANIEADLWSKLVLNCAGNAVTAIAQSSYGRAAREPLARELMVATAREAVAVARAAGVELPEETLIAQGLKFAESMGEATSSTAQDVARKRKTEIDALNGLVVRRGRQYGVPTPVNHALLALVKLIEAQFS